VIVSYPSATRARARSRAVTAVVAAIMTIATILASTACTSDQQQFCDDLKDQYTLSALRHAIDANDTAAIEAALAGLQRLEDEAPSEVRSDLSTVLDTVISTVRAVTDATGPNGEKMPVDTGRLNTALAGVATSSQHVVAYADRKCALKLAG
jgi:high-affinity nickel permease